VQPGTRLGPYQILAPIGSGGMGEVYRARDARLDRDVAIKVLPADFAADPERLRRFEREAKATATLSHPNILAVHDVGTVEGVPYLVEELLEGESLKERLDRGAMPVPEALEIAVQVARGLAAAHERHIVHRDLKPGNVFITRDGTVKILDFGLAKVVAGVPLGDAETLTQAPSTATEFGRVLGTLAYMAPEQARGLPVDPRSDIFSFGVVLYEMLAGRRPFRGGTATDTVAAILKEDPPPLPETVPAALQGIVARCLQKRQEDRFSSGHELVVALRGTSSGSEAPTTKAVRARTLRLPKQWLLGAAVTLLLGAVAGLLVWAPWRVAGPPLDPKRVVVAPFENRTGNPSFDSLGSLIAEAVTRTAALGGGTAVVPGTAFREGAGEHTSAAALRALARASGAGLVVSGATYAAGDELRIQAQLFDPLSGSVIVTLEPITGSQRAAASLLEPLRQRVLGAVACRGDDAMFDVRLIHVPTLDAYLQFRQGLEALENDGAKAGACFTRASELDPSFVLARCLQWATGDCESAENVLADLESRQGEFTPLERLQVRWSRAKLENRAALQLQVVRETEGLVARGTGGRVSYLLKLNRGIAELDLNLPRQAVASLTAIPASWLPAARGDRVLARYLLLLAYHMLGEYEKELGLADESLREAPDEIDYYAEKVKALGALGRVDDIDRVVDEALAVKFPSAPVQEVMSGAARELRSHGHREAAIRMAEREIALLQARPPGDPAGSACQRCLMTALMTAERWAAAKSIADSLLASSPDNMYWMGVVGMLAAHLGDTAQARQIAARLRDLKSDCNNVGEAARLRAQIAAQLGEKREAVALLKEAVANGDSYTRILGFQRDLEPLWDDPEYKEFIRPKG
jgi:tetratricopeptide (TPR) repeat protein/TolB-like protein